MILFFSHVTSVFACEVIDDEGFKIQLNSPATRIISLAPDITELLFAAGAGKSIVGVMQGSDYPDAAKKIPVIANYNKINIEAILTIHPDLIVAWKKGISSEQLSQLKSFGLIVYISNQKNLTDIPATIKKLGCLCGTETAANQNANDFLKKYLELKQIYARTKPISVFYQMWSEPLLTINKDSWVNQVITLCGGKNIFANAIGATPQINFEAVLLANPDVIFTTETSVVWKAKWKTWPQVTAVKNKNLFYVPADLLERAGPRLIEGAAKVCEGLHKVNN